MIEKIIRLLKRDPSYKWEHKYSIKDLLIVALERLIQVFRGGFEKLFFKRSIGLVFVGRNVKIRHSGHISVGRNFIASDGVYINGLSHEGITIGDDVSIGRGATLVCTGVIANKGVGIRINDGVGINSEVYLGGQGGITIGSNTIIGPGVKIFSENHIFSDLNLLIKKQGEERKPVIIGENCWIGSGATILAGVSIGAGNVVAAGSIVTKSFDDNNIIAGIPGKVLKKRE